jgi:hypothetical protein
VSARVHPVCIPTLGGVNTECTRRRRVSTRSRLWRIRVNHGYESFLMPVVGPNRNGPGKKFLKSAHRNEHGKVCTLFFFAFTTECTRRRRVSTQSRFGIRVNHGIPIIPSHHLHPMPVPWSEVGMDLERNSKKVLIGMNTERFVGGFLIRWNIYI